MKSNAISPLVRDPENIRIGMIGMTEGNGHPYSWSAMFNRFNKEAMTKECPFPAIPGYLNKENYDTIGIPGAKVCAIYCDKRSDAEHVAKLSLIPEVFDSSEDMIGKVDAVIIATDIGNEHVRRAKPFIEAGLPIFIDKPLCDNLEDLDFFRNAIASGAKIISSSSYRYCKEIAPYFHGNYHEIGKLRFISMTMCKKWETYGIHALEGLYAVTGGGYTSIRNLGDAKRNIIHMTHKDGFDAVIGHIYDVACSTINLCGTMGCIEIKIGDSYSSFRNQLVAFIEYLRTGVPPMPFEETAELMKLVAGGITSREQGGKEILI